MLISYQRYCLSLCIISIKSSINDVSNVLVFFIIIIIITKIECWPVFKQEPNWNGCSDAKIRPPNMGRLFALWSHDRVLAASLESFCWLIISCKNSSFELLPWNVVSKWRLQGPASELFRHGANQASYFFYYFFSTGKLLLFRKFVCRDELTKLLFNYFSTGKFIFFLDFFFYLCQHGSLKLFCNLLHNFFSI